MDIIIALLLFGCVLIFIPGAAGATWKAFLFVLTALRLFTIFR